MRRVVASGVAERKSLRENGENNFLYTGTNASGITVSV